MQTPRSTSHSRTVESNEALQEAFKHKNVVIWVLINLQCDTVNFVREYHRVFFPWLSNTMFQTEKLICTTALMFFILRTTAIELNSCMKTLRAYLDVLNVALRRPSPFEILPLVIQEGQVNIVINRINGFRESLFMADSHCLMN